MSQISKQSQCMNTAAQALRGQHSTFTILWLFLKIFVMKRTVSFTANSQFPFLSSVQYLWDIQTWFYNLTLSFCEHNSHKRYINQSLCFWSGFRFFRMLFWSRSYINMWPNHGIDSYCFTITMVVEAGDLFYKKIVFFKWKKQFSEEIVPH